MFNTFLDIVAEGVAWCHIQPQLNPVLVPMLHTNASFYRMKARHDLMKKKYPDKEQAHGIPFTGLSNARPETKALAERPKALDNLPFDYRELIEYKLPWDGMDPSIGQ